MLAATGLLGGFNITLGLLALVTTTGALSRVLPAETAHVLGSLTFGIGFVLLTVGRSELFTENFLVPVAAVLAARSSKRSVLRLWTITFAFNLAGIAIFVGLLSVPGVLDHSTLQAAGTLADTLAGRGLLAAAASAVVGGAIITAFTWLAEAAESDLTRLFVALLVGFVLLAPSTNHSIVGFGEILFGLLAGTTGADWVDLVRNTSVAVLGNVVGGIVLIAFVRSVQADAR